MKKTDLAMIILIAVASVTLAFFGTRAILGDPTKDTRKAPVMEKINANIEEIDTKIFNKDAINPAVEVQIDGTSQ